MDAVGKICKSCQDEDHDDCINQWLPEDGTYPRCYCVHTVRDAVLGAALRDAAMEAVDDHADPQWKAAADAAMELCCRKHEFLTTDAPQLLVSKVQEERAWSGVIARARAKGWIEKTNEWWPSDQPQNHLREKKVWHSLIWEGP